MQKQISIKYHWISCGERVRERESEYTHLKIYFPANSFFWPKTEEKREREREMEDGIKKFFKFTLKISIDSISTKGNKISFKIHSIPNHVIICFTQ